MNIPIIYFSVLWWSTLHQPPSLKLNEATMGTSMLVAILLMTFCFWFYTIAVALVRVRNEILDRERNSEWVVELLREGGK